MSQSTAPSLVNPEINTGCKTPRDAWEQVKAKKREMRDRKTFQAALNLQAAIRHYMTTLRYEIMKIDPEEFAKEYPSSELEVAE